MASEKKRRRGISIKEVRPGVKPSGTFGALKDKLAKQPGVKSPGGLAAAIGREKFGAARFARMAAKGRRAAK